MLEVNDLTKSFGSLDVLKGVNMQVEKGEMVALMGPSGSGKSTLLNIIGGLLAGDGGNITLDERTLSGARSFQLWQGVNLRNFERDRDSQVTVPRCCPRSSRRSALSASPTTSKSLPE